MTKKKRTPKTNHQIPRETEANLTEPEQDLLSHMDEGYQLETDSLKANPVLRNLKSDQVMRPIAANRNTIQALERRGLISPGKANNPLTIVWHRVKKN